MLKIVFSIDLRCSNLFLCIGLEFDNSLGSDVDVVNEVFQITFDRSFRVYHRHSRRRRSERML